ncbi:hypothetical protein GN208_14125 [Morganella sp. HSTU-ASny43]|uniref:hypothetical protein n=1 Tax=Morganella sp. HSTU-ASny43 TaxID=2681968 RepID=UPI001FB5732F|nr:hypothetical protein [Morganella sp. HSTU-ASny43]MCJ1906214.1 hypothetical protein [Morganella sp. HSTU-ASny43]
MKIENDALVIQDKTNKTVCVVGRLPAVDNITDSARHGGDIDLSACKNSNDKTEIGDTWSHHDHPLLDLWDSFSEQQKSAITQVILSYRAELFDLECQIDESNI